MGIISDILDSMLGNGSEKVSSDPKETQISEKDDNIRVKNSDVVIDHSTGDHVTMWSTTDVDTRTGNVTVKEGGHGEKYEK